MNSWSLVHLLCSVEVRWLWLSIDLLWGSAQAIKTCQPPSKYFSRCSLLSISGSAIGTCRSGSWHQYFWMVSFTILYLSFVCYSLYDAVIARARSSRTEGSRQLVVVLLIVYSDRAGRDYSPPSFVTRSVSVSSDPAER